MNPGADTRNLLPIESIESIEKCVNEPVDGSKLELMLCWCDACAYLLHVRILTWGQTLYLSGFWPVFMTQNIIAPC